MLSVGDRVSATISGWDPGNIISDVVFTNKNSMSVGQIQDFLNSKVPVCDTAGTQPSEYGGGTRAEWAANASLHPIMGAFYPPFTCLKDYTENGLTSAQIIYNVAQQYQINPQVLIVLLQKEQGLVTDTWPSPMQYRSATGYGCPDTSVCDTKYYGFTRQLYWAATGFHSIVTNTPAWSNPYGSGSSWFSSFILGQNSIKWHPDFNSGSVDAQGNIIWENRCGQGIVNIQNLATVALYTYTPYQPNQSAINSGYGNGDACSSYGNRNFYLYFTDWFNSTQIPINCVGTEKPNSFVRSFYNPRTFDHFYSALDCDISFLERLGYINEGAKFNTTPSDAPWAVPIYRYYNPDTGMHVWTAAFSTPEELAASKTGYQTEAGIVFYTVSADMPGITPIASFYNPKTYLHALGTTPTDQEISDIKKRAGYDLEGTVFYSQ
ncbi:hypothetical protein HGB24_00580 [Candidatus Saccharibacteria bacterium]|nr:hypothetical protein [Candidatus Saccharibacteria bacterium]